MRPSDDLRETVFSWFSAALAPLREAGRLGLILLQFPPYFTAEARNRDYIVRAARLLTYVCVDEPRLDSPTVLPPVTAVTAPAAYVRFHGRNAATWNAAHH